MTSEAYRKSEGLTQKEFAKKYGIPVRTVQNWDYRSCMPEYVANMLKLIACQQATIERMDAELKWQNKEDEYQKIWKKIVGIS